MRHNHRPKLNVRFEAMAVGHNYSRLKQNGEDMQSLANALAIAVSYLDQRAVAEQGDCDVQALEAVMAELQPLSENEKQALVYALAEIGRHDLIEGLGID